MQDSKMVLATFQQLIEQYGGTISEKKPNVGRIDIPGIEWVSEGIITSSHGNIRADFYISPDKISDVIAVAKKYGLEFAIGAGSVIDTTLYASLTTFDKLYSALQELGQRWK